MGIVKSPSFIHSWAAPAQHGHRGSAEEEGSVPLPKDPRAEGLACLPTHLPTKCHSRPIVAAKGFQSAKLLPIQPHPHLSKETAVLKSLGQRGGRGDTIWDCREVLQSEDGHVPRPWHKACHAVGAPAEWRVNHVLLRGGISDVGICSSHRHFVHAFGAGAHSRPPLRPQTSAVSGSRNSGGPGFCRLMQQGTGKHRL